jgi:eukaryotic-like serine/threonine-protein kinase
MEQAMTPDSHRPQFALGISAGTRLNGVYEIDGPIASGGMAHVFKGHEIQTGDAVAIKIIRPDFAQNEAAVALFRREAAALHNLHHEAIVRYLVFAVEPTLQHTYLAMEFVDGQPLSALLRRGPLPFESVLTLLRRVAGGLQAAHERGIIHRDVSPDNIIIPDGDISRAKIIDFGIARSTRLADGTVIGSGFAGKYNYVSPEQLGLVGGEVTAKSDIYSFGLVLAEALVGEPIDMGGSQSDIVEKRRHVPDLRAFDLRIRPLLERMLQPLPADRPASMAALAAWSIAQPDRSDGGSSNGRRKRGDGPQRTSVARAKNLAFAGLVGTVALGGIGVWLYLLQPAPQAKAPALPTLNTAETMPSPHVGGEQLPNPARPTTNAPPAVPVRPAGSAAENGDTAPSLDSGRANGGGATPGAPEPASTAPADVPTKPSKSAAKSANASPSLSPAGNGGVTPALGPAPAPSKVTGNGDTDSSRPSPFASAGSENLLRISSYIKQFDGGDCFFAEPVSLSENTARIEGYGASRGPFDQLDDAFRRTIGFEADIGVREVTVAQCAAVSFLSRIRNDRAAPLTLSISTTQLRGGEPLTGSVSGIGNRHLELLLVSDMGSVRNLSASLKPGGDVQSFDLRMQATDGAGAQPELLIAIASGSPLATLVFAQPLGADQLFPLVLREAAAGSDVTAAAKYFKLQR